MRRVAAIFLSLGLLAPAHSQIGPVGATLFLDFEAEDQPIELHHGARRTENSVGWNLEFTSALQYAEFKSLNSLDGIDSMSVGGWFFPRRSGEQYFFFRGVPETGPQGERFFRPQEKWVNFVLGTDQHGFLLGTINGNGSMPFAHVTLDEIGINAWHQLVVVKDAKG